MILLPINRQTMTIIKNIKYNKEILLYVHHRTMIVSKRYTDDTEVLNEHIQKVKNRRRIEKLV